MALRRIKSLRKQDGDGHWSDPAGDRRAERGAVGRGLDGNVPDVAWVVASVDHHGTRLDPLAPDQLNPPSGSHEDVRLADVGRQVVGPRVAVGDRRVAGEQQHPIGMPRMVLRPTTASRLPRSTTW